MLTGVPVPKTVGRALRCALPREGLPVTLLRVASALAAPQTRTKRRAPAAGRQSRRMSASGAEAFCKAFWTRRKQEASLLALPELGLEQQAPELGSCSNSGAHALPALLSELCFACLLGALAWDQRGEHRHLPLEPALRCAALLRSAFGMNGPNILLQASFRLSGCTCTCEGTLISPCHQMGRRKSGGAWRWREEGL